MWPSLFDDPETKASFERLRSTYDERMAFMVAAIDGAYRKRVSTGYKPLEAYAASMAEAAKINALVEGFPLEVAAKRERQMREKTMRESIDNWTHPHEQRLLLSSPPAGH